MAEKYYSNLKIDGLSVEQVKEKAVGFVYVPAQVVSEYLRASRVVQWVVPNSIKTESIEMVEVERTSSPENRDNETENHSPTGNNPKSCCHGTDANFSCQFFHRNETSK